MSDSVEGLKSPLPAKQDPEAFVLRGKPRRAVRFRRGLIVGMTGAIAAVLVSLSWFALEPPSFHKAIDLSDSDGPAGAAVGDALADAPANYGDVPRLGPPLPGDLGRPILAHERELAEPPADSLAPGASGAARMEAERERRAAERLNALSSPVMAQLAGGGDRVRVADPALASNSPKVDVGDQEASGERAPVVATQQEKLEFADAASSGDLNPDRLRAAPSPWMLSAGTVIPASLITGLNSDLPGTVLAQVTENVRDSATGRVTLIPQGARLIGSYDSLIAYGQRRALLVWTRIVLPDGSSVRLDKLPASDPAGFAGIEGEVDSHGWQLLKGVALSTLFGVGTELSLGGRGSSVVRAIRESAQQNAGEAGAQITSRNLDVQPTIRVKPGWPVRAIVNKDLVLQPWRG